MDHPKQPDAYSLRGCPINTCGEVGVDAPIARFVCSGECRAAQRGTKSRVARLRCLGRQTRFNVAQRLSRQVNWAKARQRYRSAHLGVRARSSP